MDEQREFRRWLTSLGGGECPLSEEIEEARNRPNGWVYRIAGRFEPDAPVPPEAIIGAWKVNSEGKIVGSFIKNAKYNPAAWPHQKRT